MDAGEVLNYVTSKLPVDCFKILTSWQRKEKNNGLNTRLLFQIEKVFKDWLLTDLSGKHFRTPLVDNDQVIAVGNYEIPGIESLYWLAPEEFLGNKLEAYNAILR